MRTKMTRLALVAGALVVAACRASTASRVAPLQTGSVVGETELARTGRTWLFDALHIARPLYFSTRGATTIQGPPIIPLAVVVNGLFSEDLDVLRGIPVTHVREVRRLSVPETYGTYHRMTAGGALVIVLR